MNIYGMLVSYEACINCQKCVEACCRAHGYTQEQSGLKLSAAGPFQLPSGKTAIYYIAAPTDYCGRCVLKHVPACAKACSAGCISWGEIQSLGVQMTQKKMALFSLAEQGSGAGEAWNR